MIKGSATSLTTNITVDDEIDEGSSLRIKEIIFLPFHPIFQFFVVVTAILKVYLVSLYLDLLQYRYLSDFAGNNRHLASEMLTKHSSILHKKTTV